MLNFCDFIQVFVFTTNHHFKVVICDFIQVFVFTTNHHFKVVICGKYKT